MTSAMCRRDFAFEGRSLAVLWRNDQPWWIARQVGEAFEYEDGSKLVDQIADEWSDEFIEGTDFVRVTGKALAEVKAFLSQQGSDETNYPRNTGVVDARARHLLLLSESGINLAAIKTRKPAGKRLRRWLASEVLPALRACGTYTVPGATQEEPEGIDLSGLPDAIAARLKGMAGMGTNDLRRVLGEELGRFRLTPESRRADINERVEAIAKQLMVVSPVAEDRARSWVMQTTLTLAGWGGRPLELLTPEAHASMCTALRALRAAFGLLPARRRRKSASALDAENSQQLTLEVISTIRVNTRNRGDA